MEQSPSRLDDATNVELESTTPGAFTLKAVFWKLALGFRSLWRKQLGTTWPPPMEEEREADMNTNTGAEVPRTTDTLAPRSSASAVYSSARIDRMMQTRSTFSTDLEFEIDSSKDHWSEVAPPSERVSQDPEADFEQGILAGENINLGSSEYLRSYGTSILKRRWDAELLSVLFRLWPCRFTTQEDIGNQWKVGRKLGEGAQAKIFEAIPGPGNKILGSEGKYILKVFRKGIRACDLQRLWPKQVATGYSSLYACPILRGILLDNGQFAFLMPRYWGDLRKLLDERMQQRLDCTHPPFSYREATRSMLYIAKGMRNLHILNIVHGDLKAANVLVEMIERTESEMEEIGNKEVDKFYCRVADFESSKGVLGTGFWRAPEILLGVKHRCVTPNLFTKASDVYSYAMTCYEIWTGCLPFEDFQSFEYDIVLGGERPTLPWCLEPWIEELLGRCWHVDPCERPTFQEICDTIANCTRGTEENWQQHEGDGEGSLTIDEVYDILEEDKPMPTCFPMSWTTFWRKNKFK